MDAGGELYDYASDITRTWPASGTFTEPQAEVYEAVLDSQVELIQVCVCVCVCGWVWVWVWVDDGGRGGSVRSEPCAA